MNTELQKEREELRAQKLDLDLTRGKPSIEQVALSQPMLTDDSYWSEGGIDCRNYGGPIEGLPEARELFGQYMGVSPGETLVYGNSSLALMHDVIVLALADGFPDSGYWWGIRQYSGQRPCEFICPVPGYDRHFAICERYGINMIPVVYKGLAFPIDEVEEYISKNEACKGIWCVPKYSNSTGITYTEDVVRRLVSMKTAAPDFKIFWDNAYAVHGLIGIDSELPNIMDLAKKAGTEDRVLLFGSTSKITFAGGGVAFMGASKKNIDWFSENLKTRTIGDTKLNQLRHVKFLRDMETLQMHMKKHADIMLPKFRAFTKVLGTRLPKLGLYDNECYGNWYPVTGGYFICFKTFPGQASKVIELCKELGVHLTPAGATFPYGKDPGDEFIRIAPSYLSIEKVGQAAQVFAHAVLSVVESSKTQ